MPRSVAQRHRRHRERERVAFAAGAQLPQQSTSFQLHEEVGTRAAESEHQETVDQLRPVVEVDVHLVAADERS